MFARISKRTPKRTFKTCIRLSVCMQYVRDFLDDYEPETDSDKEAKRRLRLLVGAFDKVVISRMMKKKNDGALWDLCNRLESHIGKVPNVAEALKACELIIRRDARRGDAIKKLLPVFKEFKFKSSSKLSGKMYAFLSYAVKVDD